MSGMTKFFLTLLAVNLFMLIIFLGVNGFGVWTVFNILGTVFAIGGLIIEEIKP